ncbi:MAG: DUF2608 domain-containing protein [Alphaproteobacteria bacterium]|nr:DUF2608 domain-containing protein [Alphaproteobacteria bacterium]
MFLTSCKEKIVKTEILEISDINKVQEIFKNATADSIVLCDIDDTIITPKSKMFRYNSEFKNLIDVIKKNRENIPNFNTIIGNWRLNRKAMLVSPLWPSIIADLKTKNIPTYALTQLDTGKVGPIESMEEWRYQELKNLGIEFTNKFNEKENYIVISSDQGTSHAVFHKGFFLTGLHLKDQLVKEIISVQKPDHIYFIDDRKDHVIAVEEVAKESSIPYTGIVYKGVELLDEKPHELVVNEQKKQLLENAQWLEDEEVEQKLSIN